MDGPVLLTRSAPAEAYSGCLMMYDVVDAAVVARSGVLQCIVDAGGDTSLPTNVSLSEFNVWRCASPAHKSSVQKMGVCVVFTLIKVADALDDVHADMWMTQLAEHLVAVGCTRRPTAPAMLQEICQGLSDLPDHLLARIFKHASRHECGAHAVLKVTPRHLHAVILATNTSLKKKLIATFSDASTLYLRALSSLPSSPPSILSLRVRYLTTSLDEHGAAEPTMFMLSNALRHHSGLHHLSLDRCCTATRSAVHLPPAVATLSSLQRLSLGSPDDCCACHDLPRWQAALLSLPQIKDIKLHVHDPVNPHKRHREESTFAKSAPVCLAVMLAASTSVSSLALHIKPRATAGSASPHIRTLTATTPLALPCLRHLTLTGCWLATAGPLLHHLQAPLTSLVLTKLNSAFLCCRETDPDPLQLFRSLSTLTGLLQLHFEIPMCIRRATTSDWWESLAATAASSLRHLSSLRDLHLKSGVRTLLRTAPAALAASTALSRLQISCRCSGHGHGCVPTWAEWNDFITGLSVPSVQELRIWMPHVPCDHIPGTARLLHSLSALTCLRLTGYDNCFGTQADLSALSQLTRLQHLSVHEFTVPTEQHAEFARALMPLTGLTHLALTAAPLGNAFAAAFAVAAVALSGLRQLRIGVGSCHTAAETLVRAAASLPVLRELTLYAEDVDPPFEDAGECLHKTADLGGALVRISQLTELAASLGVKLVCDSGPELRSLYP